MTTDSEIPTASTTRCAASLAVPPEPALPEQPRSPGSGPTRAPVLVVAAAAGTRGAAAAALAAAGLRDGFSSAGDVVALPAGTSDLAGRVASAAQVYVLDPGRVRSWRERLRARLTGRPSSLVAPARVPERLALLQLLRHHQTKVTWVTRRQQLECLGSAADAPS